MCEGQIFNKEIGKFLQEFYTHKNHKELIQLLTLEFQSENLYR